MCGIIGYIGPKEAANILLAGLERLEYRGYDSAGISILGASASSASQLQIVKSVGKIATLSQKVSTVKPTGTIGIGHTRWATHGVPSVENAHPHTNKKQTIAVVHNGIIENASHLRTFLESKGYVFVSQTDTETIVHLIDYHLHEKSTNAIDFESAFRLAVTELQGTYGLVAMHIGEQKLYAARKGSPLIIGVGQNEMFVSSDASALIENTRTVQYLQDGDIAVLTAFGYNISTIAGLVQPKQTSKILWSAQEAEKNGHAHFMLKEILEQPSVLQNTIRGRLRGGRVKLSVQLPPTISKVHIVACGTSYHAGLIGKYYIEQHARIPVEVHIASEFRYADPILHKDDIVVAISQSGETADTLAAVLEAKRRNITTIGLVNVVGSTIAREVTSGVYIHAGIEVGVASTKAFTCQVASLLLLSLTLAQHVGKPISPNLQTAILQLPTFIDGVLSTQEQMRTIAQALVVSAATDIIYLGRHIAYPVALEGALKLKEISYIHAEGFAAGEMKHGPIALIEAGTPIVCLIQKNHVTEKMISNIQEMKARRGKIIAISEVDSVELRGLCDEFVHVSHVEPELSAMLLNIPLQLLAYYVALAKGLDVDKPRNLAKSVTVE